MSQHDLLALNFLKQIFTKIHFMSTREGGVFFDDEVDEEELLEAFVKRFPRERTLSSPDDLLKKRDPGVNFPIFASLTSSKNLPLQLLRNQ